MIMRSFSESSTRLLPLQPNRGYGAIRETPIPRPLSPAEPALSLPKGQEQGEQENEERRPAPSSDRSRGKEQDGGFPVSGPAICHLAGEHKLSGGSINDNDEMLNPMLLLITRGPQCLAVPF